MSNSVTIALFAHVQAALDETFALAEVLEKEGIAGREWAEAQVTIRRRVAEEIDARVEYEEALVAAQDRFERSVAPVDTDVGAWLALVDGMTAAPAPFGYLTRLGLRMSDIARLRRRWTRRVREDEALDVRIAELRAKRLAPLPPLRIGTSAYVVLRGPAAVEAAPASRASGLVDGVGIDVLARIEAEFARAPQGADAVLARSGLDRAQHERLMAKFHASCARDATLLRDYQRLVEHATKQLQTAAVARATEPKGEPERAPPPPAGLRSPPRGFGTILTPSDSPHPQPLPFEPAVRPSALAQAQPPAAPRAATEKGADDPLDATLEVDRGRAAEGALLPFPHAAPVAAASAGPRLTLEQFASLSAEMRHGRVETPLLLARYSIPSHEWAALDASWRRALAADDALRVRFETLLRQYVEFLAKS